MKRYGFLYEKIVSEDNCKKAIIEAARHKHKRSYVTIVIDNIDEYAKDLSNKLKKLEFTTTYRLKEIEDGLSHKRRVIQVPKFYPDQCAHHAIIQVLQPIILRSSYHWSCANIKGRGIDYASIAMTRATHKYKVKYCSKMDISKFYPSVPNQMLKDFIRTKIKDEKALKIIYKVIDTHEGLPIGNYTSPWFAEWYLQRLDHFIKERLGIKYYVRYADDIVLMGNNKKKLHNATKKIIHFVSDELGLKIKSNYQVYPIDKRKIDFILERKQHMWKKVQGNNRPETLEERPDEKLVYVRKNIKEVQIDGATLYEYEENAIESKDWGTYTDIINNELDITDLQMTVIDLYEMIIGGK